MVQAGATATPCAHGATIGTHEGTVSDQRCDDRPAKPEELVNSRYRARPVPWALFAIGAWSWRLLAAVAAASVVAFALLQLAVVVVPVVLALFLGSVLEPPAAWLRHRRWPSLLSAWVVFAASLLATAGLSLWLATQVTTQFDQLGQQLDRGVEEVKQWLTDGPLGLSERQVDRFEDDLRSAVAAGGGGLSEKLIGRARLAAELLGGVVLTLFTLFFVIKDGERIGDWVLQRAPPAHRHDLASVASKARLVMRQYLLATAVTGFIDAVLIAVVLAVLGVPLVLPLAILVFVGGFFPVVGATVAGAVAALVALVSGGLGDALVVAAATIVIQQLEGNLLQPLVLGRAVNLHPLVTTWSVAAGLVLGGLVGGFLAVPLVATATRVLHHYRARPHGQVRPGTDEASPEKPDLGIERG